MRNGKSCLTSTMKKFSDITYSTQPHTLLLNGKIRYQKSLIRLNSQSMPTNSSILLTTTTQLALTSSLTRWEICSKPLPQRKPEKLLRSYSRLCLLEFRAVYLLTRNLILNSYPSISKKMTQNSRKFLQRLTSTLHLKMRILTTRNMRPSSWNSMTVLMQSTLSRTPDHGSIVELSIPSNLNKSYWKTSIIQLKSNLRL